MSTLLKKSYVLHFYVAIAYLTVEGFSLVQLFVNLSHPKLLTVLFLVEMVEIFLLIFMKGVDPNTSKL
jgi:hypothetical protein